MTTEPEIAGPGGSSMLAYPQTKLRIVAQYPVGKSSGAALAGRPETVEIELNDDAVPDDTAERAEFITQLLASLFRDLPALADQYNFEFQGSGARQVDPDAVQTLSEQARQSEQGEGVRTR